MKHLMFFFQAAVWLPLAFAMFFAMLAPIHYLKVFYFVVGFVTINVMNMFMFKKFSFKKKLHHMPMFQNLLASANTKKNISLRTNSFTVLIHRMFFSSHSIRNAFVETKLATVFVLSSYWFKRRLTAWTSFIFKLAEFTIRHKSLTVLPFSSTGVRAKSFIGFLIPLFTFITVSFQNSRHYKEYSTCIF